MKIVPLIQGTPEWHAYRSSHFNASDVPAMLGCSPYKTRAALLREYATGLVPDVAPATQRRFDDGHRFEALARPLAEEIIGDDLYPCVGENGRLSASFDGITLDAGSAFEHKTLNASLRAAFDAIESECGDGTLLPEHYRVQMEQQCMVSGADRVLFMASRWDDNDTLIESAHCWYYPDMAMRSRIIAGWEQFERDVAAYVPEPPLSPAAVAAPVAGFGMLSLRVEGRVLASNLDAFKAEADAFIGRLPKPNELQSDQDFADAESAVKACAEAEDRIKSAREAALAQMHDVASLLRTAQSISDTIRAARLALEKAVKAEKESRKESLVNAACRAVRVHYVEINATIPPQHALGIPASLPSDIASAIKGLKSLSSMRDKLDSAVAAKKIEASHVADRIRANVAIIEDHPANAALFADRISLCATKDPADLRNLVTARIAAHEREQAAKLEAERELIRREESARIEAQHAAEERGRQMDESAASRTVASVAQPAEHAPCKGEVAGSIPVGGSTRQIKLGDINAAIAPLSITADGLAQLGFNPVGQDRAAKLYRADDFGAIVDAMMVHLRHAWKQRAA